MKQAANTKFLIFIDKVVCKFVDFYQKYSNCLQFGFKNEFKVYKKSPNEIPSNSISTLYGDQFK